MQPDHLHLRPSSAGDSHLRRQDPEHFIRLLETRLSALIDARDTPGWKIHPADHPDVMAFLKAHANNSGFTKRARVLQKNRGAYYSRACDRPANHPTALHGDRATVVDAREPIPKAIPIPMAIPVD